VEGWGRPRVIGNTPLVSIDEIYIKLEYLNPSGSVKDRIAQYILDKAEKQGLLKKGYTVIEASSGNTGIAFSRECALRGYKMVVVIPKGLSKERTQMMRAYGAEVVNVKKDCFTCAINETLKLGEKKRTFLPRQFDNVWNVEDHEKYLGNEIIKQMGNKKIDAFVAGVGTGGTVIGVGKALKKRFPGVKIFALEPDECHILASSGIGSVYGKIGNNNVCKHHGIEGIGDGIIPGIIERNKKIIDGIIEIKSRDAIKMCNKLAKRGYLVGPSSGANILGAFRLKNKYKNVVTLFPDRGDRYLSENIFD
jgi:cysteine synthase